MNTTMFEQLPAQLFHWLMTKGLVILVIIVVMYVGFLILQRLIKRLQSYIEKTFPDQGQVQRVQTLTNVFGDFVWVLMAGIGLMTILSQLGIDLAPFLVAAGVGGIAIGFGAQSLVKDVISGFFLLLEDQIRVGDVVMIADVSGLVEDVGLRTIVLRDDAGNVHIVPNGTINTVTNKTKGFSRYVFHVGVAYREDVDDVMQLLQDIGATLQQDPLFSPDIVQPFEMLGVDQFADSAVVIKCRITTKPRRQWTIGREMNRRIKKTFDERGIEMPFPHRTLYWGDQQQPQGQTQPALEPALT
mgnify:CR=1 FL=1